MQEVRILLVGLGNLGRRFCEILLTKDVLLRERYGLVLQIVGAADSRGVAYDADGLDPAQIVQLKKTGGTVADYPGVGRADWDAPALVSHAEADILLEASPVNLDQGAEPALTCVRTALQRGMHVATPNKGPMVLAYDELHALAHENGVKLRFDGTVAGGLPAVNLLHRDLRGATVSRIEAVPNLTTGYVMDLLAEGASWEEAKQKAKEAGVLEGDGVWDLEGWDTTAKLAIMVNAALGITVGLEDIAMTGITELAPETLRAAREDGKRYRLLARAVQQSDGTYDYTVEPVALFPDHPLGRLGKKQIGLVVETDIYGTLTAIIEERTPIPSAATMLRDLLDIYNV